MPEPHFVRRHDNVWVCLKPRRNGSLKFNVILRSISFSVILRSNSDEESKRSFAPLRMTVKGAQDDKKKKDDGKKNIMPPKPL